MGDKTPGPPTNAPFLSEEERSGLADLWRVYDTHFDEVWDATVEVSRQQSESARDLTDAQRAWEQLLARQREAEAAARALVASERQLRAFAARLQQALEAERTRIAREIHDQLGQQLTSLKMDIDWLLRRGLKAGERGEHVERMREMSSLVDATVQTVRRLATELRPGVLDDLGLKDALEWQGREFQSRSGIDVRVVTRGDVLHIDDAPATALFRCFQEILTNAARHSNARHLVALLERRGDTLALEVTDDGRGILPEEVARASSLGLLGMRERAALLGGSLRIEGASGRGTRVTIEVPLPLDQRRGSTV